MADGTGLPLPKAGTVLAQPTGVLSGDAMFNAQSWQSIANSGANIAKDGADYLKVSEHQAKVGYLADQDVEIQRKQIELRDQHAENPQAFDAAWKGYTEGKLTETAPWAVGHVKIKLGASGNAAYSAVLNETRSKTEVAARASWGALEDMASTDVTSAAMAGTLDTYDGRLKIEKYRGVVQTGVTSRFIPPEEAERRIATLESTATIYGSRAEVKKRFEADGPMSAASYIDDLTRNEGLRLSPEQRLGLASRMRADVHSWDAERRQSVEAVSLRATALIDAKQKGLSIPQGEVDDTIQQFKKFGGQAQAASFLIDLQYSENFSFLQRVPLVDGAAWLNQFAIERGMASGSFETRLKARESSLQPGKVNQLGYAGLYQFGAPRLTDLGVYTPGAGEDLSGWSKSAKNADGKWSGTFNIPGFENVKSIDDFLRNPAAQKAAFDLHNARMDKEIDGNGLYHWEGSTVGGVPITRDGLRAMLHLGGVGGARKALESAGANSPKDANGTFRAQRMMFQAAS